jgi:hypothetical protein
VAGKRRRLGFRESFHEAGKAYANSRGANGDDLGLVVVALGLWGWIVGFPESENGRKPSGPF